MGSKMTPYGTNGFFVQLFQLHFQLYKSSLQRSLMLWFLVGGYTFHHPQKLKMRTKWHQIQAHPSSKLLSLLELIELYNICRYGIHVLIAGKLVGFQPLEGLKHHYVSFRRAAYFYK